jgi:hypothetical protein
LQTIYIKLYNKQGDILTSKGNVIKLSKNILDSEANKSFEKEQNRKDFVISTEEKSSREARQRLDSRCGVTCEDFSSVEMTRLCLCLVILRKIIVQKA